jgi:hypothetical protein
MTALNRHVERVFNPDRKSLRQTQAQEGTVTLIGGQICL